MNIGITTFGSDAGKSGIGRYTINVIRHMSELETDARFDVYAFRDERQVFADAANAALNTLDFDPWMRRPVLNIAWHQTRLPSWCRRRRHNVLFLPAGNRRLPVQTPCPTVGTIHDFSSLHVTKKYDSARMFYITRVLPFLARRLSHVLTVSESSKRDIVEYARVPEERVTVTPLAVDHERYQQDPVAARERLRQRQRLERPYLLYVSRIEHPGKNHIQLIEAFNELKRQDDIPHQLVIAGSDWSGAEVVHEAAAKSAFAKDIRFTGFVSDDDLLDLYTCADMLVFPSQYEGFGLPVLEAMACKVPVACADASSLPEVAGNCASYFAPLETDSMIDAIRRLLHDPNYRRQCIETGYRRSRTFTWQRTAQATLEALQRVAD